MCILPSLSQNKMGEEKIGPAGLIVEDGISSQNS